MTTMPKISCVLITRDEEKNIVGCLESAAFCDERIVVDAGSRDHTRDLAEANGAKIFVRPFSGFADQKNYGIRQASGEWIFLIDADERVSQRLAEEIRRMVGSPQVDGYLIPRQNRLFGRWITHGANTGDVQLRLIRNGKGLFEGSVHERVQCRGTVAKLRSPLYHYSTETLAVYMKKLNDYTSLEALGLSERDPKVLKIGMERKPFIKFFYDWIIRAGILDGFEGFLFAVLSAYYDFVKRAKAWELKSREQHRP